MRGDWVLLLSESEPLSNPNPHTPLFSTPGFSGKGFLNSCLGVDAAPQESRVLGKSQETKKRSLARKRRTTGYIVPF